MNHKVKLFIEAVIGLLILGTVITGSLIPTFSIATGDRAVFTVDGLGEAVMDVS